jgi:CRP-like cAMP-binding protein
MSDANVASGGANRLLAALPQRDYRQLAAGLESVPLDHGAVLFEAGEPIRSVYFPDGGLVSILVPLEGEKVAEVAVVGQEGMVGLPVFLGASAHPHRAVVQIGGSAWRLPATALRAAVRRSPALSNRLLRYVDAFLVQVSQSAVCNCLHSLPKRYCRWLLMAHDRLGLDRLPFTQKFLALMLTVRLASVSEATGALERAGLIRYRRGELHILDRPGLEAACCGCYRLIQNYFEHLPW